MRKNSKLPFYSLFCLLFSLNTRANAQHEKIGDPYVPASAAPQQTSPAHHAEGLNYWTVQVNVNSAGNNILNDAANEPSLAVNPKNPAQMIIGWRQFDNINNNFRQAGYAYSIDGGLHWTFPGVIEAGVFRSDPVLDTDADGNFYYNSLTVDASYHCKVFKSNGFGAWDAGVEAFGGDKQWMAVDKTEGPGKGNIYAAWNNFYTSCGVGNYTRSTDEGASFESCELYDAASHWSTITIGPDGTVFISSANSTVARSANAQHENEDEIWDVVIVDMGGVPQSYVNASPNPVGLLSQPWIVSNHAENDLKGQLYILCSLNRGNGDPLDVMFTRSTDNGETWSDPIRLNDDDPGDPNWQWMGTMSVAPTGRIDAVWLDTRDNPGSYQSSLYYTNSYDGGLNWLPNQRLSMAFDPWIGWPSQQKMGDYFHMISDSTGANLAWAGTFTGGQDVYFTRIEAENATGTLDLQANSPAQLLNCAPNPFSDHCTIQYQLQSAGSVQIDMVDPLGRTVRTFSEGIQQSGRYTVQWDGKNQAGDELPSGVYFGRLRFNNLVSCGKIISLTH